MLLIDGYDIIARKATNRMIDDATYIHHILFYSLFPLLTRQLVENYLDSCKHETRSQLLFTTHNGLLMDQSLFRRDEMWVAERNSTGQSSMFSFSEYKDVRYDKDIRKSYLQGRLGGIPRIQTGPFSFDKNNKTRMLCSMGL